jgi:hypothetical protein
MKRLRSMLEAAALLLVATAAGAADVTLDGAVIPNASSTLDISVGITEFREGGESCPRLVPGCPKLGVCIAAPAPVASLDAQLAGAAPARFAVGVEDGRVLSHCVPESLETRGGRFLKQYRYCLRCEGLSGP